MAALAYEEKLAYSGSSESGLNVYGSFDRAIFVDREYVRNYSELKEIVNECLEIFERAFQSRLVVRLVSSASDDELLDLQNRSPEAEIDFYPADASGVRYVTFSYNKDKRRLDGNVIEALHQNVRCKIAETFESMGDYERFSLEELDVFDAKGYSFTRLIKPDELERIWKPFNWSMSACAQLVSNKGNSEILGVRDLTNTLVAVALYDDQSHVLNNGISQEVRHGETTEWSTDPLSRDKGIMPVLLTGFHSMLLEKGIGTIWADLRIPDPLRRSPHSISPAIKSGMKIPTPEGLHFLSTNHVTISGEADTHNRAIKMSPNGIMPQHLRSFAKGYVDAERLTSKIRSAYLDVINSN